MGQVRPQSPGEIVADRALAGKTSETLLRSLGETA
ncbi:MAG: hypothetical protein QOD57_2935 [Actinomycetota bacterium]|jgi:hypothetical protein|nr:hypothetical protein [Actinomycetota bacterium]